MMRPVKGPLSNNAQRGEEDDCIDETKDAVIEPTSIDSTTFNISRPSNTYLDKLQRSPLVN